MGGSFITKGCLHQGVGYTACGAEDLARLKMLTVQHKFSPPAMQQASA